VDGAAVDALADEEEEEGEEGEDAEAVAGNDGRGKDRFEPEKSVREIREGSEWLAAWSCCVASRATTNERSSRLR
jgi:hypothetical protein